ncbi:hypothetical protein Pflav_004910 [Phytohabitans flavus]|uniref:Uncharacterized protein n=1 Tax=Phytohabitans flavus TaxID=1076124 RepID=A0A6F8XJW7_9ACTN|nr:hypothetical protein Pflav_004910 [Phytohabitans flavus]
MTPGDPLENPGEVKLAEHGRAGHFLDRERRGQILVHSLDGSVDRLLDDVAHSRLPPGLAWISCVLTAVTAYSSPRLRGSIVGTAKLRLHRRHRFLTATKKAEASASHGLVPRLAALAREIDVKR